MLPPLHNRRLVNVLSRAKYIPLFNTAAGQDASAGWSQQLLSQAYRTQPIEKLRRTADNAEADVRVDLRVSPPRITMDSAITVTSGSSDAVNLRDFVTPPEVQALYGERMYFDGVDDYVMTTESFQNVGKLQITFMFNSVDGVVLYGSGANSKGLSITSARTDGNVHVTFENGEGDFIHISRSGFFNGDIITVDVEWDMSTSTTVQTVTFNGEAGDGSLVGRHGSINDIPFTFGRNGNESNYFSGTLYDVKLYDTDQSTLIAHWEGHGITNADWLDTIGSNNGTVNGSPALFTGQGFGASFADLDDQTGNGATASQSTAASQPLIVEDGVLLEGPTFDGVDDHLSTLVKHFPNNTSAVSVFLVASTTAIDVAKKTIISQRSGTEQYGFTFGIRNGEIEYAKSDSTINAYRVGSGLNDGQFHAIGFVRKSDGTLEIYLDGSIIGTTSDPDVYSQSANTRICTPFNFEGIADDILIYQSDKSADYLSIQQNQMERYNIS